MAAQTTTGLDPVLKELYPQKKIDKQLYEGQPFFGLVPKSEDFFGVSLRIATMYAPTTGRSSTFATAQANKGGAAYRGFDLTRVSDYALFSIETEAIRAAKNDRGALLRALETEGDAARDAQDSQRRQDPGLTAPVPGSGVSHS